MLESKDYCDDEIRKELIKLGYPAHMYDNTEVDKILGAILLYEAQKWLREEKGVIVGIINNFTTQEFDYYVSTWAEDRCRGNEYTTYENALLRGIKEAVKILKDESV